MANNVNTHVTFDRISEEGKSKLLELTSRIRNNMNYRWLSDMWVDGKEGSPTYEETEKYEWTTTNIGPKWNYIEDAGDDYLTIVSAWSWPENGIAWIVEQIAEVDPQVRALVSYEDEMPNFFGAAVFEAGGLVADIEWDSDEIEEMMHEEFPELLELWDAETNEPTDDEYWNIRDENIWSYIGDKQWEWTQVCIEN